MKKFGRPLLFLFVLISGVLLNAQHADPPKNTIGVSAQFYPAGFIPTVNFEHFTSDASSFVFRLGGNFVDRKDFSEVNETEEGGGFGGSVGYRKHFPLRKGKLVAGLNLDLWSLNIDWTDRQAGTFVSGSTYTLVVQPWLEGGYFLPIKNTNSQLGITLGLGREINAITSGEEVAQGFIGSISLQYLIAL